MVYNKFRIYRNFRLQIVLRIFLICVSIFGCFFLILKTQLYLSTLVLGIFILFQIYAIIHYVDRTNRNMIRFLEAIRHADFSQSFSNPGLGNTFNQLNAAFSEVMEEFKKIRNEKEENYRYLHTIVQHVGVGLVAFDQNGKVELINTAAKKLLKVTQLRTIDKLKKISSNLYEVLLKIKPGEKKLVKIMKEEGLYQLIIYATGFRKGDISLTLVSIQNIQSELEEQEMEAWQKLIRVLTHEIMNSVTPISSLAATASDLLKTTSEEIESSRPESESIADVQQAVHTIKKRSEGLLHFVQAYRSLTQLPKPNFKIFSVAELYQSVQQLMEPQLLKQKIELSIKIFPETLEITADQELIVQVLLNLIKNSLEALSIKKDGKIELSAKLDARGRIVLEVFDNGLGMTAEAQEKVFIPFFTTKKQGSGIGLSLSRQIMRLHRGNISLQSKPNVYTVVRLIF